MDLNKKILIGIIVLIVLLLVFNVRISYLKEKFDKYCIKTYNLSDPCPCVSKKQTLSDLKFNISSPEPLYK